MEFFSDDEWRHFEEYLVPKSEPFGERGRQFRERVNEILYGYAAQVGARNGRILSFKEAADAGEKFLQGLRNSHEFLRWLDGVLNEGRERRFGEERLREDHVDLIRDHIASLRMVQGLIDQQDEFVDFEAGKDGNAAKPWLHDTIARLYVLWVDADNSQRPQKDFFLFAFRLLQPAGAGVTENSIELSFRRHAKQIAERIIAFRDERSGDQLTR